jgi:hypothetical protein
VTADDDLTVYWCKRRDGLIVEHTTTAWEGHRGHVRCVPVGYDTADPEAGT